MDGITKSIKFDENGLRSDIEIQISTLQIQGIVPIAVWTTDFGIKHIVENAPPVEDPSAISLKNQTFIVLTSLVSSRNVINFIQFKTM